MEKVSYALGLSIGNNFQNSGIKDLNVEDFVKGLTDVLNDVKPAISYDEAKQVINDYFLKLQKEKLEINKKAGEEFLLINRGRAGVVELPSGLQYEVIIPADGPKPTENSTVTVHYEGRLTDGTKFDSSYDRKEPATFQLTRVIKGWTEGVQLMSAGAKYKFYVPYTLGYGERGAGGKIPPYSTLIFTIELIEFK